MSDWSRRKFLELAGASVMASSAGRASAKSPERGVPRRPLGRTGEMVSMIGLGGYHIGKPSEREAIALMHRAIDEGIDFFDNCWDYHEGESERRMGKALEGGRREKVFLMTKLDGRTRDAARSQLEDSLRRLRADRVDLVQMHEIIRDEDPQWVFGPLGAMEVLMKAKEEGKLRFIGFTGHKSPEHHLAMLDRAKQEGFRFDAVQMPLNVADARYESFQEKVLPRLVEEKIGVLGMKPLAGGYFVRGEKMRVPPKVALRYAASLPVSTTITGMENTRDLEQALEIARGFEPMAEKELQATVRDHAALAEGGRLELYKTSRRFDGTVRNPHWLSTARVKT